MCTPECVQLSCMRVCASACACVRELMCVDGGHPTGYVGAGRRVCVCVWGGGGYGTKRILQEGLDAARMPAAAHSHSRGLAHGGVRGEGRGPVAIWYMECPPRPSAVTPGSSSPPTTSHAARHSAGRTRLPPASNEYLQRRAVAREKVRVSGAGEDGILRVGHVRIAGGGGLLGDRMAAAAPATQPQYMPPPPHCARGATWHAHTGQIHEAAQAQPSLPGHKHSSASRAPPPPPHPAIAAMLFDRSLTRTPPPPPPFSPHGLVQHVGVLLGDGGVERLVDEGGTVQHVLPKVKLARCGVTCMHARMQQQGARGGGRACGSARPHGMGF